MNYRRVGKVCRELKDAGDLDNVEELAKESIIPQNHTSLHRHKARNWK